MKKANLTNFMIIAILFIAFYIINIFLTQNNIDITLFKFNYSNIFRMEILIAIYFIFMVLSTVYASRQVFNLYIKHKKGVKLIYSRILLIIASIIVAYSFILFNLEFYYYFGSIIILYMLYFILLFIYDNNYVKKSRENKIKINDEVVNQFLDLLGGKDNIVDVSYEYSRLKVELKNIKLVNLEKIKQLGAQGAFVAGNKLQAIIGNNAHDLENAIKQYISIV